MQKTYDTVDLLNNFRAVPSIIDHLRNLCDTSYCHIDNFASLCIWFTVFVNMTVGLFDHIPYSIGYMVLNSQQQKTPPYGSAFCSEYCSQQVCNLQYSCLLLAIFELAQVCWETWNRTKINGFKGHCPTFRRSPNKCQGGYVASCTPPLVIKVTGVN